MLASFCIHGLRFTLSSTKRSHTLSRIARNSLIASSPSSSRSFIISHVNQDEKRVVYLSKLPWFVYSDHLKLIAEQFGPLEDVKMPTGDGQSRKYANLVFVNPQHAADFFKHFNDAGSIQIEEHPKFDANLRLVDKPRTESDTLYVKGLHSQVDAEKLRDAFNALIASSRVMRVKVSSGGDYAHVQFRTVREALQAFKAHLRQPLAVDGRNLYVAVEKQDREPYNQLHFEVFGPTRDVDMPSILTSLNLAYKRVRIMRDKWTKEYTNEGFIDFVTTQQATAALRALEEHYRNDMFVEYGKRVADRVHERKQRAISDTYSKLIADT